MEPIFTDLYNLESREFRITREATLSVLNNPDKIQEIAHDDLFLRIFIAKEKDHASYLLILAQIKDNRLHLLQPFRIPRDLFPNIQILEPLMVLELLAHAYGLILRIGRYQSRFIYQEDIPLQDSKYELLQIFNPNDHDPGLSTFIKITQTPTGNVAKCALAFCIDRTAYRSWLFSGSQMAPRPKITDKSITRIISPQLITKACDNTVHETHAGERFNLIELGLALEIIRKVMGDDWHQRVLIQFPHKKEISNKEYRRLVKSDSIHPLSEALWSGKPENYIRIISLATYFNQLWCNDNSNNLSDKIKELRQYTFAHAYYELKTSAYFDKKNLPVTFIKREKDMRTPDFRIDSEDGFAFAECKRKDAPTSQIDDVVEEAAMQIEGHGFPGIIFVEVSSNIEGKSGDDMLERAKILLEERKKVSMFLLTREELRDEFGTWVLATRVRGFENKNTYVTLPEMIKKTALFQDPIRWIPLSQTVNVDTKDLLRSA